MKTGPCGEECSGAECDAPCEMSPGHVKPCNCFGAHEMVCGNVSPKEWMCTEPPGHEGVHRGVRPDGRTGTWLNMYETMAGHELRSGKEDILLLEAGLSSRRRILAAPDSAPTREEWKVWASAREVEDAAVVEGLGAWQEELMATVRVTAERVTRLEQLALDPSGVYVSPPLLARLDGIEAKVAAFQLQPADSAALECRLGDLGLDYEGLDRRVERLEIERQDKLDAEGWSVGGMVLGITMLCGVALGLATPLERFLGLLSRLAAGGAM